jgi:hypothetical protein
MAARLPGLGFARASALVALIAGPGCRSSAHLTLRDTEGRTVAASCNTTGNCVLAAASDSSRVELRRSSRFVGLCSGPNDYECRALECAEDVDCPPLSGRKLGSCVNGLCIEPGNPIQQSDAVMLCLAGSGHGRSTTTQVDRYALAVNCGSPCRIPSPCRQP